MIEQSVIALFGVIAVWLSQDVRRDRQRFACIAGLVAQPAWIYATWKAQQWGICLLALVYTAGWCRGIWNYWIQPWRLRHGYAVALEWDEFDPLSAARGIFYGLLVSLCIWLGIFRYIGWV